MQTCDGDKQQQCDRVKGRSPLLRPLLPGTSDSRSNNSLCCCDMMPADCLRMEVELRRPNIERMPCAGGGALRLWVV